ncbi:hypothetical protein HK104_003736 [Borealophlyctis nickersoniae]|nr:hypothetical protein HK104_003736 [Borealophlyctis nickersoniae]
MATKPLHPYYPLSVVLPHYKPPTMKMGTILTLFFTSVFILLEVSYMLISRSRTHTGSRPPFARRLLFLWFVACGFIHLVVEGYFAYNNKEIAGQTHVLAELWKEYALSDSRYMTSDPFVVIMESITAVLWGTGSFFTAYAIYRDHPIRHILQFLISTGQLYGDILYYLTTLIEGAPHCSTDPFHFWFYFVFLNAFWIVIPAGVMAASGKAMYRALKKERGWKEEDERVVEVSEEEIRELEKVINERKKKI